MRDGRELTPLENAREHAVCKTYLQEMHDQNAQLILAARAGDIDKVSELFDTMRDELIAMQRGVDPRTQQGYEYWQC